MHLIQFFLLWVLNLLLRFVAKANVLNFVTAKLISLVLIVHCQNREKFWRGGKIYQKPKLWKKINLWLIIKNSNQQCHRLLGYVCIFTLQHKTIQENECSAMQAIKSQGRLCYNAMNWMILNKSNIFLAALSRVHLVQNLVFNWHLNCRFI